MVGDGRKAADGWSGSRQAPSATCPRGGGALYQDLQLGSEGGLLSGPRLLLGLVLRLVVVLVPRPGCTGGLPDDLQQNREPAVLAGAGDAGFLESGSLGAKTSLRCTTAITVTAGALNVGEARAHPDGGSEAGVHR